MNFCLDDRTIPYRIRWWLLLLALTAGKLLALSLPQEHQYSLDISDDWAVYVDGTGSASFDEVRSQRYQFVPVAQFQPPLQPLHSYWLRLSLENPVRQQKQVSLAMDLPLARNIQLYQINGPYIKSHSIGDRDGEGRQQRRPRVHFTIALPPDSTTELYVKLSRPWQARFATILSDPLSAQRFSDKNLLIAGFCYGGIFLLWFTALSLSWSAGRHDYLWLALLSAAAMFHGAIQQGALLLLAPVNDSGARGLQLAPLLSQALFIITLLLYTRCIELNARFAKLLHYTRWAGIVSCLTLLLIALFDFGLALYGLALAEAALLLLLLGLLAPSLTQGRYRPAFFLVGILVYSLGAWPILSTTLLPVTGFYSGSWLATSLDSNTLYKAGLLAMLLLFAIGQAKAASDEVQAHIADDSDDLEPDIDKLGSLALQHLNSRSNPEWWRLTEASFDGVILCEHGQVAYANQAAADIIGHNKIDMTGKPLSLLVGSDSDSQSLLEEAALKSVLLDGHSADGSNHRLELRSRQQWVEHRQFNFVSLRLVTERPGNDAFYDGLTGLAGQQLLNQRVEQAARAADRNPVSHALLLVELDQLQALKQRYGRQRTDRLLQALATRLDQGTRRENTVARIGEAQFAIFVEHIDNPHAAAVVAAQLLQALERPVLIDERQLLTSTSVGIALYPQDATDLPHLLQLAEQAARRSRDAGEKHYQFHSAELDRRVAAQLEMESAVRHARDATVSTIRDAQRQRSFTLALKPIMDLQQQTAVAYSAGLIWPGAPAGYHQTDSLLGLAAEVDLDRDISAYLLQALSDALSRDGDTDDQAPICVKIAASYFWAEEFIDDIAKLAKACGSRRQRIIMTFDEATLAAREKHSIRKLHQLEKLGFQLGLDHFAEAHTSLLLLRSCAIHQVAITTCWIKSMGTRRQDLKTLRALITLCHRMHIRVLVEQLHTDTHLKVARLIDCDWASGPLIDQMLQADSSE